MKRIRPARLFIALFVFSWVVGIGPQIFDLPLKIRQAHAAVPVIEDQQGTTSGTATDFVVSMPATRPAGHLYIAIISKDDDPAITAPAGGNWQEAFPQATDGTGVRHGVWWKIGEDKGSGNEDATYTWTGDSEEWAGEILRITGFRASAPINQSASATGGSGVPISPTVTPTLDDCLILRTAGIDTDTFGAGYEPTGHTAVDTQVSTGGGSNSTAIAIASINTPPAAGNPTDPATFNGGVDDQWVAGTIAIAPPLIALADHSAGQESDALGGNISAAWLEAFAFQLSNATGETKTLNDVTFQLSSVNGMEEADFNDDEFYIYVDADGSGNFDDGETALACTLVETAITGSTGTIAFTGCSFDISDLTTVKMVLAGELANLAPGDSFTIGLGQTDLSPEAGGSDCTATTHEVDGATAYRFRKKITINQAELDGDCATNLESPENFPLLVTVSGSDFAEVAAAVGSAGHDIIFKDADGNRLDHEIEAYDESSDPGLIAWVSVPIVYYDRDTVIWMYYGNPAITVATENPDGVWDINFKGVWHLDEDGDGSSYDEFQDSTSNANHGRGADGAGSKTPTQESSGKIGNAQTFDGGDGIEMQRDGSAYYGVLGTGSRTVSAWIKTSATTTTALTIVGYGAGLDGEKWYQRLRASDGYRLSVNVNTGEMVGDTILNDGAWHYVAATLFNDGSPNADEIILYVDGVDDGTSTSTSFPIDTQQAAPSSIGMQPNEARPYDGIIDEVRISDTARSACWIGTEYSNQKENAALITLGSQENLNYNYRKKITIEKDILIDGASCSGDLENFPFLVTLTGDDFTQIDDVVGADGDNNDIIFKDANGYRLDHEIEEYDETADPPLVAWVRIPTLYHDRDTVIYLYYGNPGVDTSTENPAGVWDDNFVGVWHLEEQVTEGQSTGTHDDSTGTTDGTQNNNGPIAGRIAGGQYFEQSGDQDFIAIHNAGDDINTTQGSVSAWIKMDAMDPWGYVFSVRRGDGDQDNRIDLRWDNASGDFDLKYEANNRDHKISTKAATAADGLEHLVTLTWDKSAGASGVKGYVDGAEVGTDPLAMLDWFGVITQVRIGASLDGGQGFIGMIDEVRISTEARTACWIKTDYNNQCEPGVTNCDGSVPYTVGSPEGLNYLHRKKITVNSSRMAGDCTTQQEDLENFPLLVTLTGTDPGEDYSDIADDLGDNAYALNFIANNDAVCGGAGTAPCVLDHEIEAYDSTNGLVAWVRIPTLVYDADTTIYLHYGNPNITVSTENAAGVWVGNFVGVWHLDEDADGTTTDDLYIDSTANTNHGDDRVSATGQDGQIGAGQHFDGNDDYVDMGDVLDYGKDDDFTYTAWVKTDTTRSFIAGKATDANPYQGIWWYLDGNAALKVYLYDSSANNLKKESSDYFDDSQWHHVVVTYDGSDTLGGIKLYADGLELETIQHNPGPLVGPVKNSYSFNIGSVNDGADYLFDGDIDEVRVSNTERTACWIGTEYNNQVWPSTAETPSPLPDPNPGGGFLSVGSEEQWTFAQYKTITIDNSVVGTSCGTQDLLDFPLMIKIDGTDFDDIANDVDDDGFDIIFRDENGSKLAHEIEKYEEPNELIAWIKVPRLSATRDTVITIHYGNADITTATADPVGVWDSNYVGVYHLSNDVFDDSTGYANHGTNGGSTNNPAGQMGDGRTFDGSSYININDLANNVDVDKGTMSAWIMPNSTGASGAVVDIRQGDVDNLKFWYTNQDPFFYIRGTYSWDTDTLLGLWSPPTITPDLYTYCVFTWDKNAAPSGNTEQFSDGESDGIDDDPTMGTMATPTNAAIGAYSILYDNAYTGDIDEVRISKIVRDDCWIETEYNNQNTPATFYTISAETGVGAPTAVDLIAFTATGEKNAVQVAWQTARESGNQGFDLYRAAGPEGPFTRLTGSMIAGQVSSISEKAYAYADDKVVRGELYYYLLEDIDVTGLRTEHGPICVDWDGDGLPDDWEIAHGLNPALDDAGLDADSDGLSNLQEYLRGTDPHNADSDGDGVPDGLDDGRIERSEAEQIKSIDRGVYVVAQDDEGITIELRTEFLDSSVVKTDHGRFDRLHIGDYVHGTTETVGAPEMPLKGVLVNIPFDSAAGFAIVETEIETRSGYRVYPVPANVGDESGERVAEVFAFDEQAYAEDSFYPSAAARLGDTFVFRDQARQQIVFHPVAYNPATGQIVVYTRIRVRINYGDSPLARADRIQPMPWQLPAEKTSGPETAFGLLAAVSGPSPLLNSLIFSPILSIGLFNAALWSVPESAPPAVAAYKILVPTAGIYQLSCADLDAAGVDITDGDLSDLRVYHLGEEVAVEVVDANGAVCDGSDTIRFYAPAVDAAYDKYAADNVFWLTTGAGAGSPLRMETIAAVPDAGAAAVSHDVVVHAEDDEDYWKEIPGADSLDRWYSLSFVEATEETPVGSPVPFDISVPGPAAAGSLTVMMVSTSDKDHEVDIEVVGDGGTIVTETFTWSGLSPYEATIDTVAFDATDAAHSVRITCKSGADFILVDWIEAAYSRDFAAAGGQLEFAHAPGYIFTASGFGSNNLVAYDITDRTSVGRITTTAPAGNTFTFEPPADPGQAHTFLVIDTAGLRTAADVQIIEDTASSLYDTANGADYILITHGRLGWNGSGDEYPWLTAHAAHRRDQGLRVAVVDTADIFDEFSYGMVTPAAIRDFLAYAYENWTAPAPQYVLIVGDASFDAKGNYEAVYGGAAADDTPYVPSYLVHTDYQGETVTDEYFARISGGDAVPDLYIGRLPAADFNEATVMTAKIRAYEEAANAKDWEKNVLLVADNQEPGEDHAYEAVFKQINDDAAALLPATMAPAYGYLGLDFATAAALKNYIKLKLNDDAGLAPETGGALIVNYSGHASMQRWAGENIFENADVAALDNTGMLPFMVSMSCLAGNFSWPEWLAYPALGEELMRAGTLTEGKGAVAALVPSGQTTTAGQRILNTALFDTIFTSDIRRLGPAIAAAKQTLLANGDVYFEQVSETFLLLGDPATVLKVPLPRRPEGLTATGAIDAISLDWQAATDAEGNAVDGYNLYRSLTPQGTYTKVNSGLITATAYEDGDANLPAAPTPFYYTVSAVDGDGDESPRSAVVSAVLKAPTASLGGGGGGGAAPAACFVRTAAESATTGFPWFWVVPALFLGVARAEGEKIRK